MKRKICSIVLATALVVSLAAGAGGEDAQAAKKAKLGTKKITLTQGKTKKIKVKNKKKGCRYTFTSNKKKVATVTKAGKVKAVAAGTAKITVKEVSKKGKKRNVGVVKVLVKNGSQSTAAPQQTETSKATEVPKTTEAPKTSEAPKATNAPQTTTTPGGTNVTETPKTTETPAPSASATAAPQESKEPTKGTKSVSVYLDEISETNKIAEVNGPGLDPTPVPTEAPAGEATPVPTPAVIVNANMEDGGTDPIAKRGGVGFTVVDDGANGTTKSVKVTGRTQDWHGAAIDITSFAETDNDYEIVFYAKQETGKTYKIDLSMQYVDASGETKYAGIKSFDLESGEWTKCEAKMNIPEHKGEILAYWQSEYGTNNYMDFQLDEITVKGVAKAVAGEDFPDLSLGLGKTTVGNPVMTSRLTADPYAMEYDGRIYVYGTNDSQQYEKTPDADNNYSKINTINVYSTDDMVNWTDHGAIAVAGSKGAAKWASNSWAPAVCHKTINGKEKFFLYFADNGSGIGVLEADSPTGPWRDPIGKQLISRSTPGCSGSEIGWLFDPAVLVDDDGTGYLYFGGIGDTANKSDEFIKNPKCGRVVKLADDMISLDGDPVTIDAPYMFEDSGINKIGDKYYYSYCTNWTSISGRDKNIPAANIAVMESDNPMTGFKFVGCVLKNPGTYFGASGNNHHCFAEFKGTWYAFYHTKKDTLALGTKGDYRTTYADVLNLGDNGNFTNADGSVADTKMTAAGVAAVGTVNPYNTIEAESFAIANRVGTIANNEASSNALWNGANYSLYNTEAGSYIGVANVDFGDDGASTVSMKLSDTSMTEYKECIAALNKKVTGKHTIYFVFEKTNILTDSWKFDK